MGYFSNGSEGEDYRARYCDNCLHDNEAKGVFCPIWNLHLLHSYEECNKEGSFLHDLIPRAEGHLSNERCKMFVDRGLLSNLAIEKYEHEQLA